MDTLALRQSACNYRDSVHADVFVSVLQRLVDVAGGENKRKFFEVQFLSVLHEDLPNGIEIWLRSAYNGNFERRTRSIINLITVLRVVSNAITLNALILFAINVARRKRLI